MMLDLDPDSLRRRAIDTRQYARSALTAELRRQYLELAENYDDLADAMQLDKFANKVTPPARRCPKR
jgi:hypothetical protein